MSEKLKESRLVPPLLAANSITLATKEDTEINSTCVRLQTALITIIVILSDLRTNSLLSNLFDSSKRVYFPIAMLVVSINTSAEEMPFKIVTNGSEVALF